jgi:hypothetical protein
MLVPHRLPQAEAFQDDRDHIKQRANDVIFAMPPAERIATLIDLQDRLIDCTPEDQIDELAAWLYWIAQR